jgi:hypothetical protein
MEYQLLNFRLFQAFRNPPFIDLQVGKSSAIPAGIDIPVGKSSALPADIDLAVGNSSALPAGIDLLVGTSSALPAGIDLPVGTSSALPAGIDPWLASACRPASTFRSEHHRPFRPVSTSLLIGFDPTGRHRPFGRNQLSAHAANNGHRPLRP